MISLPNPLKCLQKKLISRLNMQNLILVYANNVQHYAKLRQIQKKITLIKSFDLVWWILYTGSESFLTNYTRFSQMNLNRKRVSKYFKHSSAKLYYKTTKYWQLKMFLLHSEFKSQMSVLLQRRPFCSNQKNQESN